MITVPKMIRSRAAGRLRRTTRSRRGAVRQSTALTRRDDALRSTAVTVEMAADEFWAVPASVTDGGKREHAAYCTAWSAEQVRAITPRYPPVGVTASAKFAGKPCCTVLDSELALFAVRVNEP